MCLMCLLFAEHERQESEFSLGFADIEEISLSLRASGREDMWWLRTAGLEQGFPVPARRPDTEETNCSDRKIPLNRKPGKE